MSAPSAGHGYMRIAGEWLLCDDAVTRPVVRAQVVGASGTPVIERFLIDSGADRTVFRAALVQRLQLPVSHPPPRMALVGVGGVSDFVFVTTAMELPRDDGGLVRVRGEFTAFADPLATDLSILGRDVLDNFDVILSRRRDEVLFLAANHQYHVAQG